MTATTDITITATLSTYEQVTTWSDERRPFNNIHHIYRLFYLMRRDTREPHTHIYTHTAYLSVGIWRRLSTGAVEGYPVCYSDLISLPPFTSFLHLIYSALSSQGRAKLGTMDKLRSPGHVR